MKEERAILAGDCFWGVQDLIGPLPSANQWQFSFTPYGWMTSVNGRSPLREKGLLNHG